MTYSSHERGRTQARGQPSTQTPRKHIISVLQAPLAPPSQPKSLCASRQATWCHSIPGSYFLCSKCSKSHPDEKQNHLDPVPHCWGTER